MNTPVASDLLHIAEASQWLVRLRDDPADEAIFNEWLRWRDADPENAAAYDRVRSLWHQFDQVLCDSLQVDEALDPPQQPVESPRRQLFPAKLRLILERRWNWRVRALVVAAGGAAIACILWFISYPDLRTAPPTTAQASRSSILPDGSAVDLGARTSIAVDFTGQTRLLRLSHGEAFFKVKTDPSRPFTVRAGSFDVTAVGTAFDVNHQATRIVVTVQEGMVAVTSASLHLREVAAASWKVAAGYQFVYSEPDATATLSSVDTSAALAWREGRLEYTRTALSAVLADINRYSEHPVELADARVGELTFTGTVFTDSIGDWVSALPAALPVTVQRSEAGKVSLSMSDDASVERAIAQP